MAEKGPQVAREGTDTWLASYDRVGSGGISSWCSPGHCVDTHLIQSVEGTGESLGRSWSLGSGWHCRLLLFVGPRRECFW